MATPSIHVAFVSRRSTWACVGWEGIFLHEESSAMMNVAAQVLTIAATPANTPHPIRKYNPHFSLRSMRKGMNMPIGMMAR